MKNLLFLIALLFAFNANAQTTTNLLTGTDHIVACNSHTWIDGNTYTLNNNTATHFMPGGAVNGMDSLVTLDLVITGNPTRTDVVSTCYSYTWINGITYTLSNNTATYTVPAIMANDCDTIVHLDLTILNKATALQTITACDNYTWIDGNIYTTNNNWATYTLAGAAANGCDSVIHLDLTIAHPAAVTQTINACSSYTWIDGITYTTSNNTATFMVPGPGTMAAPCDSLVRLDLTISNPPTATQNITACDNFTWINGINYTASATGITHIVPGTAASPCDSIYTLNLTINQSPTITNTITACDTYTWINGITYTASAGSITHIVPATAAAGGCDTTFVLNLTVNHSPTVTQTVSACDTYTWINGITYTASANSITHVLPGAAVSGCDSIVTLDLTIHHSGSGIHNVTACNSYTWIDGNTYTANNNTATYTIVGGGSAGCDSLVTLNLTMYYNGTGTAVVTACDSYRWIDGITYTANNNTATFNIVAGSVCHCDSLVTLNLTINHSSWTTQTVTACDKYVWIDGNQYTSSTNTPTYSISGGSANGCDSIVTLNLTILHAGTSTQTVSACNSYTWIDGVTYTSSNNTATYTYTGGAASGCDSIVTLNLTLPTINNSVSISGNVLTALQQGASYQWIDCNNGNAPIPGATTQSFTAPGSGDYAVIITMGACSETSACTNFTVTGFDEEMHAELMDVYPNPNNGEFTIENSVDALVIIMDEEGREVYSRDHAAGKEYVQLTNEADGMYFVTFITEKSKDTIRMVISR